VLCIPVLGSLRRPPNRVRAHKGIGRVPQGATPTKDTTTPGLESSNFKFLVLSLFVGLILKFFWSRNLVFQASPRKTMQNHYEITSKTQFWTRNVANWTESRHLDMSRPAKASPGGQLLVSKAGSPFFSSEITPLQFSLANLSFFNFH